MCKLGQLHRRCASSSTVAAPLGQPMACLRRHRAFRKACLFTKRTSVEEGMVQLSLIGTREQNMLQNRTIVIG